MIIRDLDPRGFGQNPVEWLHYISKLEIDAEADGVKHRDVSLTAAVSSLKNRVLRLYQDAAKALYGQGPYRLDEEYEKFSLDYDSWKDMFPKERKPLMKRFFTSVCCPPMPILREDPIPTYDEIISNDDEPNQLKLLAAQLQCHRFQRFHKFGVSLSQRINLVFQKKLFPTARSKI